MTSYGLSLRLFHDTLSYKVAADTPLKIASWSSRWNQLARSYLNDITIAIVRVPVAMLFYGILRFANWRLAKFSRKEIKLTLDNYDLMHRRYVRLLKSTQDLPVLPDTIIKGETLFVRLFWIQLSSAIKSILVYRQALEQKFNQLDAPAARTLKGMKFKTSKDLVDARVKGYEYLA